MTLAFLYPKAILLPLMAAVLSKQVAILELVLGRYWYSATAPAS